MISKLTVTKTTLRGTVLTLFFTLAGEALAQPAPPPPTTPPPPPTLPTAKEQCFNNGWQAFKVFKNQGDCVSFVATKEKNKPSK